MNASRRELLLALAAGAGPLLLGLLVYRQGFNLLDDGLWVLGAKVIRSGGLLYRDLFSIYGPARYLLLLPLTWLFGPSALALAILQALSTGAAAAIAFALARRLGAGGWAWLAPIGVAALGPFEPRYVVLAVLTLLLIGGRGREEAGGARGDGVAGLAGAARPAGAAWRYVALGAAWGAVGLFGLDALIYATIVAAGALYGPRLAAVVTSAGAVDSAGAATPSHAELGRFALGGIAVLGAAWLIAIATGAAGAAWWDTVIYPLTRFRGAMGILWWHTLRSAPELGRPFALLESGEALPPAWPGHVAEVRLGIRALFAGLAAVPLLGVWRCLRGGGARWTAVTALALCGWVTMSGRGGVEHLRLAWLGSLALVPALVATWAGRASARGARRDAAAPKPRAGAPGKPRAGGAGAFPVGAVVILVACAVAWGPFLAEDLWLAAHANRPGLVPWTLPGARVLVSAQRARTIGRVAALVDSLSPPRSPLLVWPAQPGLNVVLDRPPATPQATLLAGEVRDPTAIIAGLDRQPPAAAVLGKPRGLVAGKLTVRSLSPPLWAWLRDRYTVVEAIRRDPDEYTILGRAPGGRAQILALPLDRRLPDVEARLLDATLPLAGPGHTLGQTMRVGPGGLAGLQVRCVIERGPVRLPLRLRLWGREPGAADGPERGAASAPFTRALGELTGTVEVGASLDRIAWTFAPIPGTAGQEILWTVELLEPPAQAVALGCHRYDPADKQGDAYPEGTALVDGSPVSADLYFISY